MPNKTKSVTSPQKFFIGKNFLGDLGKHVRPLGNNAYVICDEFILDRAVTQAEPSFSAFGKAVFERFGLECTQKEIDRNRDLARKAEADVIIGIGGGKTLDTAKAVAYHEKLPVVIFPTIASTDAPCTALTVIYNEHQEFERYLFLPNNPDLVLADTEILAAAPTRFFLAGIGDALATYFEARACYRANGENLTVMKMKPSRTGLGLARLCLDILLENAVQARFAVDKNLSTQAVENTIEATIYLSGVGVEAAGIAAAHAIHNGMTVVPSLHGAQHGDKVTFGVLAQLILENAPKEELETVINFIKAVGLPLTLEDLGMDSFIEKEWRQVAELACAKEDSMGNMPFDVTPDDVYSAIVTANDIANAHKKLPIQGPIHTSAIA
ncbi:glycerol dehydrogenase [Azomonas macrocytogenes]|uniref:Glycerol dehydrogenase n=1 Tax=Azomonas macrocytogenes TaxID=69962 RepID=A0A839T218_AZOMA|nr:glycerol dehydrogenase [Azomonas macrocytogenes]MBB3103591.1 glycerol dehydrogenase [Azomonas macrocytogenes]